VSSQQSNTGSGSNGRNGTSQSGIYVEHEGGKKAITAIIEAAEFNGRIEVMKLLRELREARLDLRLVRVSLQRVAAHRNGGLVGKEA
jgi:hypothetical protein